VLDPVGIAVPNTTGTSQALPAVAFGAGKYLVAWNEGNSIGADVGAFDVAFEDVPGAR
jgi:hypothetical protein